MKKFLLSASLIIIFTAYSLHKYTEGSDAGNVIPPPSIAQNSSPTSTPQVSISPPVSIQITSGLKDGAYVGDVTDAYYGNVQVKAIIQNGKITDVQFLDYPHDRRTSVIINTQAMPYLKSEAIQAQSAQVDIVSGATATSEAFRQSLASALLKTKS